MSDNPHKLIGLRWMKAQFLTRANMQYTKVVDLTKTNLVNPFYPKGRDLIVMSSIRFSYRALETLVDKTAKDRSTLAHTQSIKGTKRILCLRSPVVGRTIAGKTTPPQPQPKVEALDLRSSKPPPVATTYGFKRQQRSQRINTLPLHPHCHRHSVSSSLYARSFLTQKIIGVDHVFTADINGNYLSATTPISAHIPAIRAALKLKPDDLDPILNFTSLTSAVVDAEIRGCSVDFDVVEVAKASA
ncbi:uncharacterized protein PV07_08802 [Cladophialophora immunda]|uniref:Uncharacterized protein n=1 Tax=Cladophialophora immunda TaxID=569365 RepID=A0A0D1ZD09_9EURO|nr:uncharacterized protein PV07_08802 [Cladophialophora immunda]KIW25636.1 hypothetical protein PV07_08802 [Cladophialophora immunda]